MRRAAQQRGSARLTGSDDEVLGTKVRVRRSLAAELEVGCNVVGEWGTPAAVATTGSGEETITPLVQATAVGDYYNVSSLNSSGLSFYRLWVCGMIACACRGSV